MNPEKYSGILTKWKDDKGYGFIKPDSGGQEVFLHISALKGVSRRPIVGDIILYQLTTEINGKIRASNASIKGVKTQFLSSNLKTKSYRIFQKTSVIVGIGVIGLIATEISKSTTPPPITSVIKPTDPITSVIEPNCLIKGNISHGTGRKLYHVPGAEDYETTVIDSFRGERWFCSESEAIKNGWTKAPR